MKQISILLLIAAINVALTQNENTPIVTTPLGDIKGSLLETRSGKTIFSFRGIRYAQAPVGDLRFQPPVPVKKWSQVYDARSDSVSCPQPGFRPISEDCLFLNVYTTKLSNGSDNPKRPVMIFFHAGAFYSGSGTSAYEGPKYLLEHDIVLVVPNYRLATLGFLSTGDKEAPGNNGLKDQVEVLKWVKNNIAAFGGDPAAVTIVGYSAGGASVTLHLVSPLSKGLFHGAIIMSGSMYGSWPVFTNQLDVAKRQARLVNCPDDTSANIIKCLKTIPAEELGDSLFGFAEYGTVPLTWEPVVEPDFGQPRFLPANPVELVLKGQFEKVPVIAGVTTDEFGFNALVVAGNQTLLNELDRNFETLAPVFFNYEKNTERSKEISRGFRKFYFGENKIDNSSIPALANLYADRTGFGVNRAVKILSENNTKPVYYYRFSYRGRLSYYYLPGTNTPYGVVHHDDLIYLFNSVRFGQFNYSAPESQTVDKLTTLWTNFVKTGKPIPKPTSKLDDVHWEPYTTNGQKYLDIDSKLVLKEKLYEKRYLEWEKLFPLPHHHP